MRSLAIALLGSRHLRNVAIIAAALTFGAHRASAALPSALRPKGYLAPFLGFVVLFWAIFYEMNLTERPRLVFARTPWAQSVLERLHISRFRPTIWGTSTHVQTVVCNLINRMNEAMTPFPQYIRKTIPAFDGNQVCLDWASDEALRHAPPDAPIIYIEHGLAGSPEDNYCRNLVARCVERGWRPVVNFRWRLDYGEWRDVDAAVTHITKLYPEAPIVATAFSAGAHVLLAYLEAMGSDTPLLGACVVSPALDLVKMISWMETPHSATNPAYANAMESMMRECVRRHSQHDSLIDSTELRAFEDELAHTRRVRCHWLYDKFLSLLRTYAGHPAAAAEEEEQLADARRRAKAARRRCRHRGTPLFASVRGTATSWETGPFGATPTVAAAAVTAAAGPPKQSRPDPRTGRALDPRPPQLAPPVALPTSEDVDVMTPVASVVPSPSPDDDDDDDDDDDTGLGRARRSSARRRGQLPGPSLLGRAPAALPSSAPAPSALRPRPSDGGGRASGRASTEGGGGGGDGDARSLAGRVSAVLGKYAMSPGPLPSAMYSPFGHGTAGNYERTAGNNLGRVGIPCLVFLADDDQLMPPSFGETLRRAALANPNIIYAHTHRGGHCGWHEGFVPTGASYAERFVVSFLAAVLSAESHTALIVDVIQRANTLPRVRSSVM